MKNIPINKGNYTMETQEREQLFEQYRGEGWEEEYKKYRSDWVKNAKEQIVSEWPLLVDIETSSVCNLRCPMCYTLTEEFKKKVNAKLMDKELFYKIIDEIGGHVPAIRLSLRGEPTLHPEFINFIKHAKEKGIKEVSFLTNSSKLTDDYIRELILVGADWITVSIDGVGEVYNGIRKPLKFEETYQRIKRFSKIKKELGVHRPVIKVQGIWPAVKQNLEEYYNTFESITDLIAFNPLIDYLDNDNDIIYEENFSCPQLYQRIIVAADGKVLMCANDEDNMGIVGNLHEESLYNIWHGEKLQKIRDIHKQEAGFKQLPICRKCFLPRATEDNEEATLNGRKIIIKNYVGRTQEIGR